MALEPDLGVAAVSFRPRLRAGTVVRKMTNPERTITLVKTVEQKFYDMDEWQGDLLPLLDGSRDLEELVRGFSPLHPELGVDLQWMTDYVEDIRHLGLIELSDQERHLVMMDKLKSRRRRRFYDAENSTLFRVLIPAFDPDRMLNRLIPFIRWLWSPWFVLPWVIAGGAVFIFLGSHWDLYWRGFFHLWDPRDKTFWDWVGFYVLLNLVGVWHELGHGFTLKRFGGEVHEIGWQLLYLEPTFYCRVDDAYLLQERSKRIWVSLGGPFWETIMASVAVLVWLTTPAEWWIHDVSLTVVFITGLSTLLFNINPLIKLDGYYVLMDWLDIADLREDSFKYIGNLIKGHLLGMETPRRPISRRRRRAYLLYGICSLLYTASLMTVLFTIVKRWMLGWFGAMGYLVLLGLIALAFRKKILKAFGLLRAFWLDKREAARSRRWWAQAGLGFAVLAFLVLVPRSATRVEGWFFIEPGRRAQVRAPADGLVRSVLVREGSEVELNQVLAVMTSYELEPSERLARADRERALRELAEAHRRGDNVQAAIKSDQAQEAAIRLALLEDRLGRLSLASPFKGTVSSPLPEEKEGRYLREGDTLCTVDDMRTVNLGVAISEREVQEVRPGVPARILLLSAPEQTLNAQVLSVAPVARPPVGEEEQALDLVKSMNRIRVVVGIDNGEGKLRPGMSGRVQFLTRPRSLVGKFWWNLHRWVATLVW